MTQYLLTNIRYTTESYEKIGGLFSDLKQDYIENKLNIMVLAVISMIIAVLENFINLIDIEGVTSNLIANIEDSGLLTNTHIFKHQTIE